MLRIHKHRSQSCSSPKDRTCSSHVSTTSSSFDRAVRGRGRRNFSPDLGECINLERVVSGVRSSLLLPLLDEVALPLLSSLASEQSPVTLSSLASEQSPVTLPTSVSNPLLEEDEASEPPLEESAMPATYSPVWKAGFHVKLTRPLRCRSTFKEQIRQVLR